MPSQTTTILLKCSMVDVPALNHVKLKSLYGSPGTLHKDVGGAGTKVSGKTVGGVGTATLTTLSSINNTSNTSQNKNNPVSQEIVMIEPCIELDESLIRTVTAMT
ncbi:hypothetical protein WN48_08239 [Eufriesea mexicana]|nr:hypothetical protein WN48_08239 [Eufriesea mexicana]